MMMVGVWDGMECIHEFRLETLILIIYKYIVGKIDSQTKQVLLKNS